MNWPAIVFGSSLRSHRTGAVVAEFVDPQQRAINKSDIGVEILVLLVLVSLLLCVRLRDWIGFG